MAQNFVAATVLNIDDIKNQLRKASSTYGLFRTNIDKIPFRERTVKVSSQDIGEHFLLDHPVNGELDSSVLELDTGLGSTTVSAVINKNGVFKDYFYHSDFVSADYTTASVSSQEVSFGVGDVLVSDIIYKNGVDVEKATFVSAGTVIGSADYSYYLSNKNYSDDAIFYFPITEGTGTVFNDYSLSLSGVINSTYATWTAGLSTNGLYLDADNLERAKAYYYDSNDLSVSESDKTFVAWCKFDTIASNTTHVLDRYVWRIGSSSYKPVFTVGRMTDGTGPSVTVNGTTILTTDIWYMIAGVYHPDTIGGNGYIKLYLNGVQENITTSIGNLALYQDYGGDPGGKYIRLGTSNHGTWYPFNGTINEWAVYEGELSSSMLLEMYNQGINYRLENGEAWAPVTLNEQLTFPSIGQELKYMIIASNATGTVNTESDGVLTPIKITTP